LFVGDLSGSWVLFKSITARELFKKFPEIKKALWGSEFGAMGNILEQQVTDIIGHNSQLCRNARNNEGKRRI